MILVVLAALALDPALANLRPSPDSNVQNSIQFAFNESVIISAYISALQRRRMHPVPSVRQWSVHRVFRRPD